MPADLEGRLRQALRPGDPPAGSEERMLNRLIVAGEDHRKLGRRRWSGAVAAAAMIAGAATILVLMLPGGDRRGAPAPPAAFSVLGAGTPTDLTALGVDVGDLRFPGMEPSTLRTVRRVGETTVVAGMNRDGLVCLTLIGPEPGSPPKARPGEVVLTRTRAFTQCGLPAAVERSALVQTTWTGSELPVLLVPDGVRLRTGRGPVRVADNIAVLDPGTPSVTAIYADGTSRRLRTDERAWLPLSARDRAAITGVSVPDLAGVDAGEAGRLLQASLLAPGTSAVEPSEEVPPGHVLRQSPAAGDSVDPGSRVDAVLASPGAAREEVPADTALLLDPIAFPRPGGPALARTDLGSLRGAPRVLLFVRDEAEAASARWVPRSGFPSLGVIVVVAGDREAAAAIGNEASSAAVAIDPNGALAAALGVRAPATVVLDREGRVAVRSDRLPTGPEPDPALDVDAIVGTLRLEPRSASTPAPEPPASAWWLTSRAPLARSEVDTALSQPLPCDADPDRVWAFGPVGGQRMWIALARWAPDGSLGQVVIVAPERRNPRAPISVSSCESLPSDADPRPARPVWLEENDGVSRRIFVVRDGYDRAEAGGRSYPVLNGMLVMEGSDLPGDDRITFVGRAGRTPLA